MIELVLIEARDLIAADLRGTSDPYVRVQYGDIKRRTKVRNPFLNCGLTNTFCFFNLTFCFSGPPISFPCFLFKVIYKTLNPRWNQTLEFPDDGSPLLLHVKDHNALLPTSNIGDCVVEYQQLPPNELFDKWIPLQGVKKGEIHIQITRKIPELDRKASSDSESSVTKARQISRQVRPKTLLFPLSS